MINAMKKKESGKELMIICRCGGIFSRIIREDLIEKLKFHQIHEGGG